MSGSASAAHRVQLQPAYVLHHRPYRDTSRILELFTRDHGRMTVFARGARGGKKTAASLTSTLQPFHRVLVSFSGRGDAAQLTGAEFDGAYSSLHSARTLSGFYLNELLMRLFERHDAHSDVFDLYDATISKLKDPAADEGGLLRVFEKRLLELIGYGLSLDREAETGEAVRADAVYRYTPERGLTRLDGVAEGPLIFSGATLLALSEETLEGAQRHDARRLLRAALDQYLAGRELRSREVLAALRRMR
ncbi:MAG TPA: DNA repair protein RecO [Steroidobacteraceae bacterium]|nr:DNA repair protein RecO [Steroidobacteraceae bacterium]